MTSNQKRDIYLAKRVEGEEEGEEKKKEERTKLSTFAFAFGLWAILNPDSTINKGKIVPRRNVAGGTNLPSIPLLPRGTKSRENSPSELLGKQLLGPWQDFLYQALGWLSLWQRVYTETPGQRQSLLKVLTAWMGKKGPHPSKKRGPHKALGTQSRPVRVTAKRPWKVQFSLWVSGKDSSRF